MSLQRAIDLALAEVVEFTSDIIAIDTTNRGEPDGRGSERPAAEYVAANLADAGFEPTYVESGAPGRGNVVARLAGANPSRGALLVHSHLDVVPADASEWHVHPFSGEVRDGYVWGRGAVDMKDMVAMTLAVARGLKRAGVVPERDVVFAYLSDEEAGGTYGARWLVEHRPDLFGGVTEAISEVGGFSVTLGDDIRAYLVETAQKGGAWLRLEVEGTGGHASMLQDNNPVATLARAVARLSDHSFPVVLSDSVRELLAGVAKLTDTAFDEDDPAAAVAGLGHLSRSVGATLRDTVNVTMFEAGYQPNVVPSRAFAVADARILPGREEAFHEELAGVLGPDVKISPYLAPPAPGVQTTFDGALVDSMAAAIGAEDPGAPLLPYMFSGGTDAKSFSRLGIRNFGFSPRRLPPDLDFTALFHGIDERVPVESLRFGVRVLARLLADC